MNSNPSPRRPAETGGRGRVSPEDRGRSSSRAGAGARDRRRADSQREPFNVVIYPVHGPDEGIDVTSALVDAIAMILWKLHGGNEPVNRLEAVMLLERAMESRTDAGEN